MQQRLIYRPDTRHEYWRYFTYMLQHADAWHLSINLCLQVIINCAPARLPADCVCFGLFFFCSALSASRWNWSRVNGVWAWSTLWAAFAVHWAMPGCSQSCHCWAPRRASMPCCAVMCRTWFWSVNCNRNFVQFFVFSFCSLAIFQNFSQLSHRFVRIAVILILIVSDVAFTTFHFCINHNRNPRISLEAHFGGIVSGFLCGFLAYRRLPTTTTTTTMRKGRADYF